MKKNIILGSILGGAMLYGSSFFGVNNNEKSVVETNNANPETIIISTKAKMNHIVNKNSANFSFDNDKESSYEKKLRLVGITKIEDKNEMINNLFDFILEDSYFKKLIESKTWYEDYI